MSTEAILLWLTIDDKLTSKTQIGNICRVAKLKVVGITKD